MYDLAGMGRVGLIKAYTVVNVMNNLTVWSSFAYK
jgi:siroheme synthase (precorrin-2 oxidase/ferrochelatase)